MRATTRSQTSAGAPSAAPTAARATDEPVQVFATEGIKPMGRPGRVTRLLLAIVAWAERLNLRYSKVGNPAVYDTGIFPWVPEIEREWRSIRRELDGVLLRKRDLPNIQAISRDAESITWDEGWKTFVFVGYALKSERNIRACPETWRIVQKIPGLKTAMFSIFEPGKRLPPHRGAYNGVLRLHLGLLVPEPRDKVAIRFGSEVCHWDEGRVLIFDDAYEHEAWNETGSHRVVLFVDFVKPLKFPANIVNRLLLGLAPFTPFMREAFENQRQWERRFYGQA
jgi:aspartyl/asparaginyl beta-hydroxylase (cupin superfamily)